MKAFAFQFFLSVILIPPLAAFISWLSGHDYLTWGWFFTFLGILTAFDVGKILWRRRKGETRS